MNYGFASMGNAMRQLWLSETVPSPLQVRATDSRSISSTGFVILQFCPWPIAVPSGKRASESTNSITETTQTGLDVCLKIRWRETCMGGYSLFT